MRQATTQRVRTDGVASRQAASRRADALRRQRTGTSTSDRMVMTRPSSLPSLRENTCVVVWPWTPLRQSMPSQRTHAATGFPLDAHLLEHLDRSVDVRVAVVSHQALSPRIPSQTSRRNAPESRRSPPCLREREPGRGRTGGA